MLVALLKDRDCGSCTTCSAGGGRVLKDYQSKQGNDVRKG